MTRACLNWWFRVCVPMMIGIAVASEHPGYTAVLFILGFANMPSAGKLLEIESCRGRVTGDIHGV